MKKVICYLFGHKYTLKRRLTKSVSEMYCKRCSKEFGINTDAEVLLEMDDELRQFHNEIDDWNKISNPFI